MDSIETYRIEVSRQAAGQRLDQFLSEELTLPRNQVKSWIRGGHVMVDDRPCKAAHPVAEGELIVCSPPAKPSDGISPQAGELKILFEDSQILILDKPRNLVVHPGAGNETGTLVHRLVAHDPRIAQVGHHRRPGIVHRLDKDTTGLLVVARTSDSYQSLSRDFAERRVRKLYLAIAYGQPQPTSGRIDQPIGRHTQRRKEMTVDVRGRSAVTTYQTLASAAGISVLELGLETGRTHQIRVHLKALRHPLIGDPIYGEARWKAFPKGVRNRLKMFDRPALHAWKLEFRHPSTSQELRFESEPPADLRSLWEDVSEVEFPVS